MATKAAPTAPLGPFQLPAYLTGAPAAGGGPSAPNQVNIAQINKARGGDLGVGSGHVTQSPGLVGAAKPPAPTDYGALLQQALDHANYGVGQQYGLALADIGQREAAANKMMGALPGQLDTIYNQAGAANKANLGSIDNAVKASGVPSFMSAGAYTAPEMMAMNNDHAAYQADVPTLQASLGAQFASDRSQVRQAQAAAQTQADSQKRSDQMDLLKMQFDDQRQSKRDAQQEKNTLTNMQFQHDLGSSAANSSNFGQFDITPKRGSALVTTDPKHASKLRGTPAYVQVVHALRGLGPAKVKAMLTNPEWMDGFMGGNPQYGATGVSLSPDAMSLALFDAGY